MPILNVKPTKNRQVGGIGTFLLGIISAVLLVIFIAGLTGTQSTPTVRAVGPIVDPMATLSNASPSDLKPDGELAAIFTYGSDHTELQRQIKFKEVLGKVVEWRLPVYEVKQSGNNYTIQTGNSSRENLFGTKYVGTFIQLTPRDDFDRRSIEGLKTGDFISVKGVISDTTMRNLEIRPAILRCLVIDDDIAEQYSGGCSVGFATGEGIAKGRDEYRGMFSGGKPEGHGLYIWGPKSDWPDQRYEGEWRNGFRNGFGALSVAKGAKNTAPIDRFMKSVVIEKNQYVLRGYFEHDNYKFPCNTSDACQQVFERAKRYYNENVKTYKGPRTIEYLYTCIQQTYNIENVCPHFLSIYADDKLLKDNLTSILNNGSVDIKDWMVDGGVVGAYSLVNKNGKEYLLVSNCQPNFCEHRINVMLEISNKSNGSTRLVASYFNGEDSQPIWLNSPTPEEMRILTASQ